MQTWFCSKVHGKVSTITYFEAKRLALHDRSYRLRGSLRTSTSTGSQGRDQHIQNTNSVNHNWVISSSTGQKVENLQIVY